MAVWNFESWYEKVKENQGVVTDELAKELQTEAKAGWMRQDDYNRSLNEKDKEIAREREQITRTRNEQVDWWEKNKAAIAKLRKFEEKHGDVDRFVDAGGGRMETPEGDSISRAEYQRVVGLVEKLGTELQGFREESNQKVARLENQTNSLLSASSELTYNHFEEFGKPLNMAKLRDYIKEQNDVGVQFGSISEAYSSFVKPDRDERVKKEKEEWQKKTREEIERDLRSQYQVPPAGVEQPAGFFTEARHMREKEEKPARPSKSEIRASVLQTMRESQAERA